MKAGRIGWARRVNRTNHGIVVLLAFMVGIGAVGCARIGRETVPPGSAAADVPVADKDDAVRLATDFARREVQEFADYRITSVKLIRGEWFILFEHEPLQIGRHFKVGILSRDRTSIVIYRGE